MLESAVLAAKRNGIGYLVKASTEYILIPKIWAWRFAMSRRKSYFLDDTFSFNGKRLRVFYHPYERAAEIPIAMDFIGQMPQGARLLEVGNVLQHYYEVAHIKRDILDKYEKGKGVINLDVGDYKPESKYEYIITISTMEHVGFDEQPKDPTRLRMGLEHLKSIGQNVLVTMPLGYNPDVDNMVFGDTPFTEQFFVVRRSRDNRKWEQVSAEKARGSRYGSPYRCGNGIVIGYIKST